jgi:hypothetical protein
VVTEVELIRSLDAMKIEAERELVTMQANAEAALKSRVERYRAEVKAAIEAVGKVVCSKCAGLGMRERIDSGYMRRFGLRDWDGCDACGGNGNDRRGRGWL